MKRGALGFIFFFSITILLYATFIVGDVGSLFGDTQDLNIHFPSARGLREGDDVRVDGVLFGKVRNLELSRKGGVLVTARLDKPIDLYSDTEIYVESASVLGGNFISITRGSKQPKRDPQELLVGHVRPGIEAVSDLIEPARGTFQEVKEFVKALKDPKGSIGKLVHTSEVHDNLVATLDEARATISEFKETGKRLNTEVSDNLVATLEEARGTLTEFKEVGKRLNTDRIDTLLSNAEEAVANVRKATEALNAPDTPAGKLLHDKALATKIDEAVVDLRELTAHLSEQLKSTETPAGKILNDKEMAEDLKKLVAEARATFEHVKNVAREIDEGNGTAAKVVHDDELYERANKALADLENMVGRAARAVVKVVGESKFYNESEMTISKLGIRINLPDFNDDGVADKYFYGGAAFMSLSREGEVIYEKLLEEDEDDTVIKADLYLAYRIPWFLDKAITVRAGMIEGRVGGGVDFTWRDWGFIRHPVQFSVEVRDSYDDVEDDDIDEQLDGALVRAFGKMPLWTGTDTWYELLLSTARVYGGWSRIGEDPEWFVGVGVEWPDKDIRSLVSLVGLAR